MTQSEKHTANYAEMSNGEFLTALGMDGPKWTEAFMQICGKDLPDEGNMLGWFCNAIMAGYDEANRKAVNNHYGLKAEVERLRGLLQGVLSSPSKSIDKDNMEFDYRLNCYQIDQIREALNTQQRGDGKIERNDELMESAHQWLYDIQHKPDYQAVAINVKRLKDFLSAAMLNLSVADYQERLKLQEKTIIELRDKLAALPQTKVDDKDVVEKIRQIICKGVGVNPVTHSYKFIAEEILSEINATPKQQAVSTEPPILRDKEVSCSSVEQPELYPAQLPKIPVAGDSFIYDGSKFIHFFASGNNVVSLLWENSTLSELNKGLHTGLTIILASARHALMKCEIDAAEAILAKAQPKEAGAE